MRLVRRPGQVVTKACVFMAPHGLGELGTQHREELQDPWRPAVRVS